MEKICIFDKFVSIKARFSEQGESTCFGQTYFSRVQPEIRKKQNKYRPRRLCIQCPRVQIVHILSHKDGSFWLFRQIVSHSKYLYRRLCHCCRPIRPYNHDLIQPSKSVVKKSTVTEDEFLSGSLGLVFETDDIQPTFYC